MTWEGQSKVEIVRQFCTQPRDKMSWALAGVIFLYLGSGVSSEVDGGWSGENVTNQVNMEFSEGDFPMIEGETLIIVCPVAKHAVITLNGFVIGTYRRFEEKKLIRDEPKTDMASVESVDPTEPALRATVRINVGGSLACSDFEAPDIFTEINIILKDHIKLKVLVRVNETEEEASSGSTFFVNQLDDVKIEVRIISERDNGHNCWINAHGEESCMKTTFSYLATKKPDNSEKYTFALNDFEESRIVTVDIDCAADYGNRERRLFSVQTADRLIFLNHDINHSPSVHDEVETLGEKSRSVEEVGCNSGEETNLILIGALGPIMLLIGTSVVGIIINCRNRRNLVVIKGMIEDLEVTKEGEAKV